MEAMNTHALIDAKLKEHKVGRDGLLHCLHVCCAAPHLSALVGRVAEACLVRPFARRPVPGPTSARPGSFIDAQSALFHLT